MNVQETDFSPKTATAIAEPLPIPPERTDRFYVPAWHWSWAAPLAIFTIALYTKP